MRAYLIRRLLLVIPTVFLVTIVIFLMIRLVPGSIIDLLVEDRLNLGFGGGDTAAIEQSLRHSLGLDVPLLQQYGRWLGVAPQVDGSFSGVFQGDFGSSLRKGVPVTELMGPRLLITFELVLLAMIIAYLMALPIGVYSAIRQDTWGDYIGRSFAIAALAIPGFWLATMVIVFPAIWWGYMPPIMLVPFTEDPIGNLKMFIVPATVMGMSMAGGIMRITRTMMLEVLRQDYIRTAWAKGLRERTVIIRHALKNALIPVVTILGMQLPVLIGGAVIIEQIFCLPGMGRLMFMAVTQRDYTVVSGVLFIMAIAVVFSNLVTDIAYGFLDPRIRYR